MGVAGKRIVSALIVLGACLLLIDALLRRTSQSAIFAAIGVVLAAAMLLALRRGRSL
jgi:hypothetical protein